jgi:hypothetical protein
MTHDSSSLLSDSSGTINAPAAAYVDGLQGAPIDAASLPVNGPATRKASWVAAHTAVRANLRIQGQAQALRSLMRLQQCPHRAPVLAGLLAFGARSSRATSAERLERSRVVSTSGSSPSLSASTPTAATVNWTDLSEEGRWRLQRIALPISCGLSTVEVGRQLGTSAKWVNRQLDLLGRELERLSVRASFFAGEPPLLVGRQA